MPVRLLLSVALLLGACRPSDVACRVAPLSEIGLFDKLQLEGAWEHTAVLVDASGDPRLVEGATTPPLSMSWDIEEDFLYGVTGSSIVLGFALAEHFTAGFQEDGTLCLAEDSREWHERRWMRVDWTQAFTRAHMLPLGEETEVESVFPPGEESLASVSLERDESGLLSRLTVSSWYVLPPACESCPLDPFLVEHTIRPASP